MAELKGLNVKVPIRFNENAQRRLYETCMAYKKLAEVRGAENTKLKELVSCLLTCASYDCDCDRCPINGGAGIWQPESFCGELLDRMRELGIEVKE